MKRIPKFWLSWVSLREKKKPTEKVESLCWFSKLLFLWGSYSSPSGLCLWPLLGDQSYSSCLTFLPPDGVTFTTKFSKCGALCISWKGILIQTAGGNWPWSRSSQLSSEGAHILRCSNCNSRHWFQIWVSSWYDAESNDITWKDTRVTFGFHSQLKYLPAVLLWTNSLYLCCSSLK